MERPRIYVFRGIVVYKIVVEQIEDEKANKGTSMVLKETTDKEEADAIFQYISGRSPVGDDYQTFFHAICPN